MIRSRRAGEVLITLREWLTRYHPLRGGVWDEVVIAFYARAAGNTRVLSYFVAMKTDIPDLQRHFLAALLIVLHSGVSVGVVRTMHEKHAHIRNLDGEPITDEIFDAVVAVLAGVIAEKLVECEIDAAPVILELARTVEPLRQAVVGSFDEDADVVDEGAPA